MRFLGVDLGTTNCCFAFASAQDAPAEVFPITQLVAPGQTAAEPLLESCLYLAANDEFPAGSLDLPWRKGGGEIAGRLAARLGAETPGRLVSSAKSWLSYTAAERTSAILPPHAPEGQRRVSPVEASRAYLEHLRLAWENAHPEEPFAEQSVVLTVPASFDAVARELTQQAAEAAGYRNLVLLEEPQAAFYAWIGRHSGWRDRIAPGDLVLVVDVGGGTTDFSLIAVAEQAGALALERVAVGEHLLLGGDNMDLALAHAVAQSLAQGGRKIGPAQMHHLWQQCRLAKERLLADPARQSENVTVLGRGTGLVGGSVKGTLHREQLEQILVEGFFPKVTSHDLPARQRRAGLVEVGLPYEPDAAITRHLARFLRQEASSAEHLAVRRGPSGLACPTHVLFNGGVFQAAMLRERLLATLNDWLAAEGLSPAQPLEGEDLMQAVACGAAHYGRARAGSGIRIRGGVPRTYYVGIETAMPAVPGLPPPLKALTVAPFGMEEGTSARLPAGEFGLVIGEPASFRFFASAERKNDPLGLLLEELPEDVEELAPIEVLLPPGEGGAGTVRVTLETVVTETGMLELWCVARDGRRWKLEYKVREKRPA